MTRYYLFHPSVALATSTEVESLFCDILKYDSEVRIVLEHPSNVAPNRLLNTLYLGIYNQLAKTFKMISKNLKDEKVEVIEGESIYSYAQTLINSSNSICFVNFPIQQLRSIYGKLHRNLLYHDAYAMVSFFIDSHEVLNIKNANDNFTFIQSKSGINYTIMKKQNEYEFDNASVKDFKLERKYGESKKTNIYTLIESKEKKIIKSTKKITGYDYIEKNLKLSRLRQIFINRKIKDALPQKIVKDGLNIVGVLFNYVDGVSLQNLLYEDDRYVDLMKKYKLKPCIENKLFILLKLFLAANDYHSIGVYFSDIKPDNFILMSNYEVVPIDSDGFSYLTYSSSKPRSEYTQSTIPKGIYYQNNNTEMYSLFIFAYLFLMGIYPDDSRIYCNINAINNPKININYPPVAIEFQKKWQRIPKNIRELLIAVIEDNKSIDIQVVINEFFFCYKNMLGMSNMQNINGNLKTRMRKVKFKIESSLAYKYTLSDFEINPIKL